MPKRRRRSSRRGNQTLSIVLIVLIALFAWYAQSRGLDFDDIVSDLESRAGTAVVSLPTLVGTVVPFQTSSGESVNTPVASSLPNETASGAWWEVYFTDPLTVNDPTKWENSIEGKLIDRINAAQTSIHIASFEFDLTPVAEALISAHNRGVDVRWVTDDEFGLISDEEPGHGQFAMLMNAGIEVRSDDRTALMHNKFWIFDGGTVWTGSTNITSNGIFVQDNNTIIIESAGLAAIYETEFQEMWDGQFGPRSPSQLPNQSLVVDGNSIRVIFTSEDGALEQAIIPQVSNATSKIRFLAFSYTDFPLAEAMINRSQNGVDVAGVLDKTQAGGQGAEIGTLFCAGVPVREDGNSQFMHNKIIVIDDRYVITGSMNYSTSAEESNDENVIIIDNSDIARQYMAYFDRIWGQATDPEAGDITCQ
jgi:phosphatidylserine/phosphatidylglycerophosphate/cardiolipin synthase-like enzyme